VPGDSLTPLDPRVINPIIRAYNALRNISGGGKTADGKNTIKTIIAASGVVVEIASAEEGTTVVDEMPEQGGGTGTGSGVTYEGAWSSGGSYAEDALVIHTSSGQSGLFIRITGTSGAGIEPFTTGYTTDWTLLARFFTSSLTIRNSTTEYYTIDTANKTVTAVNGNTSATIDVGTSPKVRINTTATEYSEITPNTIYCQSNAGTTKFSYNTVAQSFTGNFAGGGSFAISNADINAKAVSLRAFGVCNAGSSATALFLASDFY
jgi:hypothetical protein